MANATKRETKRLAKALHDAGVTDAEVARRCEVTERTPANWRNGSRPRQRKFLALVALAKSVGVA